MDVTIKNHPEYRVRARAGYNAPTVGPPPAVDLATAFGAAMALTLLAMCALASEATARLPDAAVLGLAAALFAAGWALQFWGHRFEGMKPAFFDDARQLLIGPLFVCAEIFFFFGAKPRLKRYVEDRVGPVVARRPHAPVTGTR